MKAETGVAFLAGAAVGALVRHLIRPQFDEDRPAIIIKNGSITFENEYRQRGWVEDDEGWHPDHCEGRKILGLKATLKNADGDCQPTGSGNKLTVTYRDKLGDIHKFYVKASGGKPKIKPDQDKDKLDHDTDERTLKFGLSGEGQIISMDLAGQTCTFSDRTGEIWVRYVYAS